MQLNRQEWTEPKKLSYESVSVDEIKPGGEAFVWQLNGLEGDEYDSYRFKASDEAEKSGEPCPFSAIAAVFAVKDENGKRLFTTDDIPALSQNAYPALERIWAVFSRLNKRRPSDMENLRKNFEGASGGDSTTGSQENSASST